MRENIDEMPDHCTIEVAMTVLGGKWKMAILYHLLAGPCRFSALMRAMNGITQRMLTRQLRELEADGLVLRTVYREVPPRVEYSLTETGRSLEKIAHLLDDWGHWYRDTRSAGEPERAPETDPAASPVPRSATPAPKTPLRPEGGSGYASGSDGGVPSGGPVRAA